jgi:putrescine aminotransferase
MILDEIQTGFARTGRVFACEYEEVAPDVLCVGKSLGGGEVPISAFITTEKYWNAAFGGFEKCALHTSTFGGNARACAAGIAAIQLMLDQNMAEKAREQGDYLITRLRSLQEQYPAFIKEIRGRGLLVGLEFNQVTGGLVDKITGGKINQIAEEYLAALVAGELMNKYRIITAYTLNNPNVIRFEPPLVVSREQIDRLLEALEDIFRNYKSLWKFVLASSRNLINVVKPT